MKNKITESGSKQTEITNEKQEDRIIGSVNASSLTLFWSTKYIV